MYKRQKTSYADEVEGVYQVYLNGEKIGMIDSQDELYALINEEQSSIKDEYNVDQVYPPKGFSITKLNTYNSSVSSVTDIYDKIKELAVEMGYAGEVKEFKANPGMYKAHVGDVSTVLRVALTARTNTPDMYEIMQVLGKNRIAKRLEVAKENLK